jgi:hypothetical protein
MNKIGPWISKMFSEPDGTPSSRRFLFALAVIVVLGFCGGYIVKRGMDDKLVDLAKTVLYATGVNTAAGKFAEKKQEEEKAE